MAHPWGQWNKVILLVEIWLFYFISGAPRAREAPYLRKSTHPRKFGNHVTVYRPLGDRPSAPQQNRCLLSHFLTTLKAQKKTDCTSMLWSSIMDNIQLTAVKTRYPLTTITLPYRGLRCRPVEVEYSFEVIRWQVTSFQKIAHRHEICCVYVTIVPHY